MKIEQVLKELGLTDKEPEVYLELIKVSGAQPASTIANRLKMHRTTVYKTLIKLSKMGLVTKTMKYGITCFLAEEPEINLENLIIKKKEKLDFVTEIFASALPELKNMEKQDVLIPKMRYYEGIEGVKRVYEDTLIEGKDIYAFENVEGMTPEVNEYVFGDYVPRRNKKGMFIQIISPENKKHILSRKEDHKFGRETRFFPLEITPIEIEINIYGNKTAFFSYKREEMFAFIIESESIKKSMKSIFDFCWMLAK